VETLDRCIYCIRDNGPGIVRSVGHSTVAGHHAIDKAFFDAFEEVVVD
jgi:hypothetical protein